MIDINEIKNNISGNSNTSNLDNGNISNDCKKESISEVNIPSVVNNDSSNNDSCNTNTNTDTNNTNTGTDKPIRKKNCTEYPEYNLNNRTTEDRLRINRMGGIASGEARRRKRTMQEVAQAMLQRTVSDAYISSVLGGDADALRDEDGNIDRTLNAVMLAKMAQEANAGNVRAFEAFRDTSGNKPKTDIQLEAITDADRSMMDKLAKMIAKSGK